MYENASVLTVKKIMGGALPHPFLSAPAALMSTLSYTLFSPFRRLWIGLALITIPRILKIVIFLLDKKPSCR